MADKSPKVFWETTKSIVIALPACHEHSQSSIKMMSKSYLETMDEAQEQRSAHAGRFLKHAADTVENIFWATCT